MSGSPVLPRVEPAPRNERFREPAIDLSVVLAWFAVLAVVGAVVWWQVTPLAAFTRTKDNGTMDEAQLARQFGTDGWFVVVAAVGGLISGVALTIWRRRDPVWTVVLLVVGGALATLVMLELGLLLGPADPKNVLPTVAVGAKVPLQLKPSAHVVWLVWPGAAVLGSLVVLWATGARQPPPPVTPPPWAPQPL
ncbi:MAG: hypothetical protein JWP74_1593 [Marmoricola sp.]|nr:hypothetical protein [Marmoricola sp.]